MAIQLFPLTAGAQQQYDRRLLPDGVLASAINCEMPRIGRVAGRARYQAIGTGVLSTGAGALVAYDLVSFLERLFVVGDDTRFGVPANLYEYLGSGVAQPWRPTSPTADAVPRLGLATRVRDIARAPDQGGGALFVYAAAFGGFVAMTWGANAAAGTAFLQVKRATDDQPVFCAQLDTASDHPCKHVRVLALSDRFLLVGMSLTFRRISVSKYAPATDTAVSNLATDIFGGSAFSTEAFGVCKVGGSDQIVVVARVGGNIKIRRLNNAGTVQVPSGGQYADIAGTTGTSPFALAVEADSSANQLTVAVLDAGAVGLYSYNLSTGAAIGTGPFDAFPNATVNLYSLDNVSLVRASSTQLKVLASLIITSQPEIRVNTYTVSTNVVGTEISAVTDATLTTQAAYFSATGALLFGIRVGDNGLGGSPNILCSWLLTDAGSRLEIVKDFEVAGSPEDGGLDPLGDLVIDASTSKYYWGNAAADADGTLAPLVTEFKYGSTERRQTAEYGGHLYLAGGVPMVFDGVSAVESGFLLRPRIVSLTASTAGGSELTLGATYNYRVHCEWTDSRGDLHLGPPSTITKITLAGTENAVTVKASGAHSRRRNVGSHPGSAVTQVASRTLATAETEPAVVFGLTSINPPSSSLNGLTLKLTAGGSAFTVTFSGSATTQATVLSEINAVVSSKVTATAPGGVLVLTSVTEGEGATIQITNGTANTILGLAEGDTGTGTTERTVGENFQRAASFFSTANDPVAEFVNIADVRADESDPIEDTDLIRQQVLYSQGIPSGAHHAPPPSEFAAAGRDRIVWSGHPKRSRFTPSKIIVAGEPAECAADGFLQYSGAVTGDIEAGYVLGDTMIFWTRRQTWMVTGAGPNRAGQGEFSSPQCVNKRIGIIADGWRSLVEDEAGVWFQAQDGELYHCSRGGEVAWKGKGARDYLDTYPVITSACARDDRQEIAFGLKNTESGNTGGILRYRADVDSWMFDDVGAVTALVSYQGRLAYLQAGIVYLQDSAPGTGTFPTMQLDSGLFQGFQGLGYGQLQEVGFLGTYRGPITITLKIGTDGETFPDTLATWSLTGAEYSVGQRVQLLVDSKQFDYDSFAIRLEQSSVAGGTEGAWIHAYALKTEQAPDLVRLAPSRRQ